MVHEPRILLAEVDHGSNPSDLVRSLLHLVELEGQECVASSHCVVFADADLDQGLMEALGNNKHRVI